MSSSSPHFGRSRLATLTGLLLIPCALLAGKSFLKPVAQTAPHILAVEGSLTLKKAAEFAGVKAGTMPPTGSLQAFATLPDGMVEPIIWLDNFNPKYHGEYYFKEPLKLPAGTRIDLAPAEGGSIVLLK